MCNEIFFSEIDFLKGKEIWMHALSAKFSVSTTGRSASGRHSGRKTNVFIKSPQSKDFQRSQVE